MRNELGQSNPLSRGEGDVDLASRGKSDAPWQGKMEWNSFYENRTLLGKRKGRERYRVELSSRRKSEIRDRGEVELYVPRWGR